MSFAMADGAGFTLARLGCRDQSCPRVVASPLPPRFVATNAKVTTSRSAVNTQSENLSGTAGADQVPAVDRGVAHRQPAVGRLDHLAVADVDPHVVDAAPVEQQIPGLDGG